MKPFLYQVAETFFHKYGKQLYHHAFVFPNRRAGVFFQKYLSEIAGTPIFSPTILTIQELFQQLTNYQQVDKIEMLVSLFGIYKELSKSDESFDDFVYWGEMLLNDFNDVDKHLVDAQQLFKNVADIREIDKDQSYLLPEQIAAIQRFWDNFSPVGDSFSKKRFQETWEILGELYSKFRYALQQKGIAYEGMIFREVAERIKQKQDITFNYPSIIFVGLNALTPSEKSLMIRLKNLGIADFYWDYEAPYLQDKTNKARFWMKENLENFPSKEILEAGVVGTEKPKVEVIAVPSSLGQTKHVTQILHQLLENNNTQSDRAINTAIVLPEESLLIPTLYSIPEEFDNINVTMGYSLQNSSVASLMNYIADLQRSIRRTENAEINFYYHFVLGIINHSLVQQNCGEIVTDWKKSIICNNRIVITTEDIPENKLLKLIFTPVYDWKAAGDYLQNILKELYNQLHSRKQQEDVDKNAARSIDLEREFIVRYYQSVTRLQDTLKEAGEMSVETYFRLLSRILQGISVPFSGEPLSGLQVMGVLETRVLDFENLIILSMNDGVFPSKNPSNSFIPYNLRKAFDMPTYEYQDSTYAYHFYRMISRAKKIFLLYDSRTQEMQTGEPSRYIQQLRYIYPNLVDMQEFTSSYQIKAVEGKEITVQKTEVVMQKLKQFSEGGKKNLSASLLNIYISCPLQFYLSAVEGFIDEDNIQESIEANVFGSIYHRVMEKIYNRIKDFPITQDVLNTIIKDENLLNTLIEQAFAKYYYKDEQNPKPLKGHHFLIGEIIKGYVQQTLRVDTQLTPFRYLASEYRFFKTYEVNPQLRVNIKGSIDRVDQIGETTRLIDYKTGKTELSFKSVESLFDRNEKKRPNAIMQVMMYGLFYLMEHPRVQVAPHIYSLRNIYGYFTSNITFGQHPVEDISIFMDEFTEQFNDLLSEIFNPNIPFSQTEKIESCKYCGFKDICER